MNLSMEMYAAERKAGLAFHRDVGLLGGVGDEGGSGHHGGGWRDDDCPLRVSAAALVAAAWLGR